AMMALCSLATQNFLTAKISFGWTLDDWAALTDPIIYPTLSRSLVLATTAMVLCALIGYPLAYFVARHAGQFRNVALLLIMVPYSVSFIIRAYAWLALLGD